MKQRKKNILERRKRRILSGVIALVLAVSLGVGLFMNSGTTTQAEGKTVVDPDTTNVWSDIAASSTSTQNIGRIWTDKSVFDGNYTFSGSGQVDSVEKGDSDFLVSLSALSSTSNLKTTTTTSQPLDIVLVLDDSGSMAYGIDSDTPNQIVYTAVSADQVVESHGHTEQGWFGTSYIQDTRGGEYYVQNDRGGYDQVTEVTETHSDGWFQSYEEHIRWTVNGQTVDPETTQFYTRTEYDLSERRGALQYAVSNFIDQAAAMNAQIADENDKIRISIVVFDSNSSIENHLTVCEGANVGTLKNTVNNLEANGATNAGAGMTNANNELRTNSNREDTKQIVIFFTDGVPTTSDSFNTTVANTAVGQASQIKSRGGSVYSIGIFDGADPSQTEVGWNPNDTDRANVFMNAVSSNYPNATAWNNLGQRASGNPDFYKSADNAGSLNEVFQDIFDESTENAGSGSPIEEVTHEGELNPGTLTFTDDLGSYMEVSGNTMTVVYGDRKFTSTNKTTAGNVDTYHFEGTVAGNAIYKEANLADLTVTVTHSDDLATGDKVTVQIPASLIPMRNYDVDTNEKTMSVSAAYPIRLFYGVSVKEEVEKAIEQGSGDVYDAIKEDHLSEDGTIDFYSNAYAENAPNGLTEATFTPSEGNKFYYYTQDTPLYVDEECNTRATSSNIGSLDSVYYADTYWTTENGTTSETTEGMVVVRGGIEFGKIQYDQQGRAYMPAHTQRTDRPNTLITAKEDFEGGNATGTALNVLVPGWNDNGIVSQALGNNGKISYPAPGELEIKKSVDWGNASDDTKQNQNSFEFTVNFNGDGTLEGDFAYDVYESGEDPVHNGTVTDGGTITLKDGQRAVIKGLPSDTTFMVTETEANKNGFTTTDTVTADPDNDTTDGIANGTIKGGSQQSVSFQNNYKADEPVKLSTETDLKVKKNLTGRDWRASDEFSFQITQIDNGAATVQMDDPTKVDITQQTDQQTASFGDITFSESGQYRFRVEELSDADQGITPIAGIDYSGAIYRVTVDVADAGQGNLEVTSVLIEQMTNDDGGQGSGEVQGDTMEFTNKYVVGQASETLQGTKIYTDSTGSNPIDAGKFSFQLEALGGYETGTVTGETQPDDYTIAADSDAMPKPAGMTGTTLETGNVGDVFQFPTIYFDGNDVGKTFEYRITELAQQYQGSAEAGMTYDTNTSYVVKIVVTEEQDPDSEEAKVVIQAEPNLQPSDITFTNKYEPTAAELTGDDAIHGTKTLEGRQMKEGETFYFQLSALNDNAKAVLADPETVTVTDQNSMDFAFDEMKFTKVGTYTFQVNEVADDQGTETTNEDGMTFDTNICTVTVTVTDGNDSDNPDDHGKLLASVSYSNDKHSNVTDHVQFTNVYEANMNYGAEGAGGIAVTKTMVDRTMAAGDFNFTLTGIGPNGEITENFSNTASAANGTVTMKQLQNLTFDEQDAEKTFSFTVDEDDPTDENRLAGVEYDQSQYRVDITVHDNHDGTMYTETTVTKIKNTDGTEANEVVVNELNSSTAQGQVPTFGFENVYKPAEASLDGATALQVTKKVTGASSPDGVNYTFTLTAQDTDDGPIANIGGLTDGKLTVSTNGVINQDATDNTDDDAQTVSFGKLTFSKPGTYTFKVQENQPTEDDGWTFDDANGDGATDEHTVTVVVSDLNENNEYDGALHIQSVTPQGPTVITNSYKADSVIVGGDGAYQQITVQKSVTGADSDAEFKFKIEPVIDNDHTQQWWQEHVQATDGFSPELTISGVTQAQAVTDSFAGIQFNAVGEYKFNVTEVGATDFNAGTDRKGWTYDEHTAVVTVKVTDEGNDGQLDAEVVYDNTNATTDTDKSAQAAAFTNKYKAGSTTLTGDETTFNGSKTIEGRDWLKGETFGFTMKPVEQEGVDWSSVTYKADEESEAVAVGENTATATENGNETVAFWFPGSYTFTEAGTYTFNVTETQHNGKALPNQADEPVNGMTYDRHVGVITVEVSDNGSGTLQTNVTYGNVADGADENDMTFENAYEPTPVVYGDDVAEILGGNKNVDDNSGSYVMADDQFTFMMRAQSKDNPMPTGLTLTYDDEGRPIVSVTNQNTNTQNNTATFDFGEIEFTKAGTYRYNIYENETNMPAGVSPQNSGRTYTITFVVEEDQTTGTLSVEASAVLIGAGDQENTEVGLDEINFTNVYNATAISGSTQIFKTMSGRNWQQGDTFTFDVEMTVDGVAADEMPTFNFDNTGATVKGFTSEAGKLSYNITITPSTSETGNTYAFSTGTATYTHEGTYIYTITERDVDPSIVNVTKDPKTYTVTVTVTNVNNALQRSVAIDPATESGRVDFTNTFVPTAFEDVPEGFGFTKEFTGHEWTEDYGFDFVLKAVDGAPMPADAVDGAKTVTVKSPDAEDGTTAAFNFGDIKYEKAGTYNYTVNEVVPEEGTEGYNAGITYDRHIANVTVTVTEDEDENGNKTGTLSAKAAITAEGDDTPEVFTNTYDTNEVTIGGKDSTGIAVQKTLAGRDWEAGDGFDFQIEAVTEDAPMPEETTITGLGNTSGSDAVVAYFGDITFTKEMLNGASTKEFEYTVSETSVSADGVTVDPSTERTVTVTVTDDGKGTLTATVEHDNINATTDADKQVTNAAAFTNTYDAASTGDKVPAGFTLTKEFTGHEWTADYAFEFIMNPKSGKLADGTEVAVADIPMPKADDNAGVTIDGDGNAHKTISGPQKGTTASFDFGMITYDKAGTYEYQVKEAKAGTTEKGVTYTNNVATITVTVTDKDTAGVSTGQLTATATVVGDTFKNTYEAKADYNAQGAGGLDITKKLNNRNMTADQFTFTIEATGDNAAAAAKKLGITDGTTTTVKNNDGAAGAAVSVVGNPFENMTFDETDDGVTYTYTIKENGTSGEDDYAGYKLDETTYTVSIKATDKGNGTMTVTTDVNGTEYTDERATAAFVNTYDAGDVTVGAQGDAQIVAHKTLKNDDIANYDGAFKFQVTSGNVVVAEGTNDRNGNITFRNITYTTENLAAAATVDGSDKVGKANLDTTGDKDVYTFTYSVSEVQTGLPGGVTYDDGNTNVTVTVTDDRRGKLSVEVSYEGDATSVEFVNTYGAGKDGTAELNLKGNKEIVPGEGLTDAPDPIDGTYTFEITGIPASDGTLAPMPTAVTTTNQNGAVEFGPITFTMGNVFGTTQTTQDVTAEEEQTAEETTVEGETATAEGEAEAVAGEEAAVTEGEEITEGETVTAGVTNANEGIELQTAGRTKTFTYIIKETAGSMPGVTNDTSEKTITVKVTDEGNGKISVVATPDEDADKGNDFTFTNIYNVDPKDSSLTGDGGFKITKTLTGRDMATGEFAFKLKEQNGDWWTAPTNPAAADGEAAEITFGDIRFTKPGTYTYTLEEVQDNKLAGVEYDSNKYTVIATVTDKDADGNYTGKLEVTWQINGAADNIVAFKNTYTADPTSVSLGAGKLIKGRDLKAGEFSFLLTDADGKEIDTAKNEENGAVTFKTITFDKAGTYSYEIREVLPEDDDSKTDGIQSSNVTYDENIYHVTVDVKDNTEKGCLEATVTYEDSDGAPVFVNTYTEPKKETPAGGDGGGTILGVKTGDVAEILPLLIVMAAAIVVIIAMSVILIRRRRR